MAGKKKVVRRPKRPKNQNELDKEAEIAVKQVEVRALFEERQALFGELHNLNDQGDGEDISSLLDNVAGVVEGTEEFNQLASDLGDAIDDYIKRPGGDVSKLIVGLLFIAGAVPAAASATSKVKESN